MFKTSALEGGLLVVGEVGLDRDEVEILEEVVVGGELGLLLEVIEGDLVMTTDWDRPLITATAVEGLRLALLVYNDLCTDNDDVPDSRLFILPLADGVWDCCKEFLRAIFDMGR